MGAVEVGTVEVYRVGISYASVCAPVDMPLEDVTRAVNQAIPTGVDSDWQPSADEAFADGPSNPCPCERDPLRLHRLFEC